MTGKIADIHVHPILKPYGSRKYPEGTGLTVWDKIDERRRDYKKLNPIVRLLTRELARDSQSNLDACIEGKLVCPFLSLYPVERQWFDPRPRGFWKLLFWLLLPKRKYHHLGAALSGFPTESVEKIMTRIREREGIDYYNEELVPMLEYTLNQSASISKNYPYYKFKIATDYNEFRNFTREEYTICGIITIEGGNSLGNYVSHNLFYKEFTSLEQFEVDHLRRSFRENVLALKLWNGGKYTPFFISFCHHFNNLMAGHSKSLAGFHGLVDQQPGLDKDFNPIGKEVLDLLLSRQNGRRILIDTKHMSIPARRYYHDLVKRSRNGGDNIPIIQSHAAINGWGSFGESDMQVEDDKLDEGAYFSRWKVNLNDEEILDIYDSDGLIGIVFHEDRMPGKIVKKQTKKLSRKYHRLNRKRYLSVRQQKKYDIIKEGLKTIYAGLIWSNIFHIVKLINDRRNGAEDGWKIIAIGSDYDGMIDPFDGYYSVRNFPALFNYMIGYIEEEKGPVYYAERGKHLEFQPEKIKELMFGKTIGEITDDICYNNVNVFLSKYFV